MKKRTLFIFGAGKQGRIVYSIVNMSSKPAQCVFLDDHKKGACCGCEIRASAKARIPENGGKVLAIANDLFTSYAKKKKIAAWFSTLQGQFMPVIGGFIAHDIAVPKTLITHQGSTIMTGTRVGKFVIVSTNCSIDHDNVLGDFVNIAPGVTTGGSVSIGEGSFIGLGAVILPGIRIGKRCIVGAGSLVRHDVPDGMMAYGYPAKVIRRAGK